MAYKVYVELIPRPDNVDDWKWNQIEERRGTHKMVMLIINLMLVDMLGRLLAHHIIMRMMQIQKKNN